MNHPVRAWPALILIAVLAGLTACGSGSGGASGPAVSSVTVTPSELRLAVGATAKLDAILSASANADKGVSWSSDDERVATVADDGAVRAVARGTTTISATSKQDPTKSGDARVTVTTAGSGLSPGPGSDPDLDPAPLDWTITFGTDASDAATAVAVDRWGYVIVVGYTMGDLAEENLGGHDAFVRKYDPDGEEVWTAQFGTEARDEATGVAVDDLGDIYVVGHTMGDLGAENEGSYDIFVRKYDSGGLWVWTEQFGSAGADTGNAIVVDHDRNVIVAGSDIVPEEPEPTAGLPWFVRKFRQAADGASVTLDWTYRTDAAIAGLAVDDNDAIIMVGSHWTPEAESEVFVAKLDVAGNELWVELLGSGDESEEDGGVPDTRFPLELWEGLRSFEDAGTAVAVGPSGNIFLTGYMGAHNMGTGYRDHRAFLMHLAPDGEEVWARLFEEEYSTIGNSLAVDMAGNVVMSGNTVGIYDERTPPGTELFIRKVSPSGELLWEDIYGDSGWDISSGTAVDAEGNIFNTGYTLGEGGSPLGQRDGYLRKYLP